MWKNIKNWEDYYEISDSGEVRNKRTKHLVIGDKNSCGYYRVCLYNKNNIPSKQRFFRHRLVAEHFIENPNNFQEVNHKDHDLKHNYVSNLEWCTRIENELDSRRYGSKQYKPFKVVYLNGDMKIFDTKPMLATKLNVSRSLIKLWLSKHSKTYTNYGIMSIEYI